MSFNDGDLHKKVDDYKRQVGGLQAALNAKKQRIDKLERVNGELCAEINRQERRIRELEAQLGGKEAV